MWASAGVKTINVVYMSYLKCEAMFIFACAKERIVVAYYWPSKIMLAKLTKEYAKDCIAVLQWLFVLKTQQSGTEGTCFVALLFSYAKLSRFPGPSPLMEK